MDKNPILSTKLNKKEHEGVSNMTLEEVQVGREVIYTPFVGCSEEHKEKGIITRATSLFVFVQYGNDTFAKATKAEDLEYT